MRMPDPRKTNEINMTEGVIWKQLVSFAVPLLIGLIFQQLYNMVDSIVVGQFVGREALAAVGSTGMIINTLIGFFNGLSMGASVVISRCFGARDDCGVHDAVHTTILMTFLMSILFTGFGIWMVPYMLRIMQTPDDVFALAQQYLQIYFAGIIGLMIYNMGAGILRAVGDSRRPLYFLIFSAVLNTVGDLVLVLTFHMGVAGVAYATIGSQAVSALLVLVVLSRSSGSYRLNIRGLAIKKHVLGNILRIGLPASVQAALTSFSNVFVQAYINGFGSACMAGWSVYGKLDQIALLPLLANSSASTTFVGQNLGAGNIPRAKHGVKTAIALSLASTAVLMGLLMLFARQSLSLFTNDSEVLDFGRLFVLWISPFYLFSVPNNIYAGALNGAGESRATMIIMLSTFVVMRQIYLYFISPLVTSVLPIALGYPLGWILCFVLQYLYYHFSGWEKRQANVLKHA
jgi:putative MATE family efflux protein